jgi:hypothetical protein
MWSTRRSSPLTAPPPQRSRRALAPTWRCVTRAGVEAAGSSGGGAALRGEGTLRKGRQISGAGVATAPSQPPPLAALPASTAPAPQVFVTYLTPPLQQRMHETEGAYDLLRLDRLTLWEGAAVADITGCVPGARRRQPGGGERLTPGHPWPPRSLLAHLPANNHTQQFPSLALALDPLPQPERRAARGQRVQLQPLPRHAAHAARGRRRVADRAGRDPGAAPAVRACGGTRTGVRALRRPAAGAGRACGACRGSFIMPPARRALSSCPRGRPPQVPGSDAG